MKIIKIKVPVDHSDIDSVMEIEAERVNIFPWINTVIHKHLNFDFNGEWVVAEFTTGTAIDSDSTYDGAIQKAKKKLKTHGQRVTINSINRFIKQRKQYNF